MTRVAALIFAKYPEPGTVNTRMVPPLTVDEAAALHTASMLTVCERVGSIVNLDVVLVVTPDDRVNHLCKLVGLAECRPQGEGDLGQRLARAVRRVFDTNRTADFHRRGRSDVVGVLLLGADSPTLPTSYLVDAIAKLRVHDAVLGPCEDGGYYLLGLRRPAPELFERIDWGGVDVADQTRRRAAEAGVDLCELPPWYDLDRFDDLERAAHDLMQTTDQSQPLASALRCLIEPIVDRYSEG